MLLGASLFIDDPFSLAAFVRSPLLFLLLLLLLFVHVQFTSAHKQQTSQLTHPQVGPACGFDGSSYSKVNRVTVFRHVKHFFGWFLQLELTTTWKLNVGQRAPSVASEPALPSEGAEWLAQAEMQAPLQALVEIAALPFPIAAG